MAAGIKRLVEPFISRWPELRLILVTFATGASFDHASSGDQPVHVAGPACCKYCEPVGKMEDAIR